MHTEYTNHAMHDPVHVSSQRHVCSIVRTSKLRDTTLNAIAYSCSYRLFQQTGHGELEAHETLTQRPVGCLVSSNPKFE